MEYMCVCFGEPRFLKLIKYRGYVFVGENVHFMKNFMQRLTFSSDRPNNNEH